MILKWLVEALIGGLAAILGAIPNGELDVGTYPTQFADKVGGALGGLDAIVPISECMVVVSWVLLTYVPMVVAFVVVRFIYEHFPIVGNGG